MRNYGDLAFRVYGNWARAGVNVLQSFQFFLNVALLIESNGQGLAQMATGANGQGFLCCKLCMFSEPKTSTDNVQSLLRKSSSWFLGFCSAKSERYNASAFSRTLRSG